MNKKPPDTVLCKMVATWLNRGDFQKLKALAEANKVPVGTYLRSIVVDAIADEAGRVIRSGDGWRS